MRALTPDGRLFTFCHALGDNVSEFAGATFDPTGTTLFVNQLRPGVTYAIRGPWASAS